MGSGLTPTNPVGILQKVFCISSISLIASLNSVDALAKPACLVQNDSVPMSNVAIRNSAETSLPISQATTTLLNIVKEMSREGAGMETVKVPNRDYAGILHELKNNRAIIVETGAKIPANARIVFEIVSESSIFRNIVCIF